MQDLTTRLWSDASWWHAGGLAWEILGFMHQHPDWPIRLWGDRERISAWAFVEPPDRETIVSAGERITIMEYALATQVDPEEQGLSDEVLKWFERVAGGGTLTATVADGQPHVAAAILGAGMTEDAKAPFGLDMRSGLEDLPLAHVPDGYSVRAVTADDLARRVAVHRSAWHPSSLTEAMYQATMETYPYNFALDVVVIAPDGEFAAACLIWHDPLTGVGELEPVGTHPDHRGLGAGPAACMAAMLALRDLGGTEACVRPRGDEYYPVPRKVYARLGFKRMNRTRSYRRIGA